MSGIREDIIFVQEPEHVHPTTAHFCTLPLFTVHLSVIHYDLRHRCREKRPQPTCGHYPDFPELRERRGSLKQ